MWLKPNLLLVLKPKSFAGVQSAAGEGPKDNPDTYLPKAHTCFFSLNLPKYSSKEVSAHPSNLPPFKLIKPTPTFSGLTVGIWKPDIQNLNKFKLRTF